MDKYNQVERFLSKVKIDFRKKRCWEWTGWVCNSGYGSLLFRRKNTMAHRVSYTLFVGPIPDGLCVLHKCDNKTCVRPTHLWVGTHQENTQDMIKKGRKTDTSKYLNIHRPTKLSPNQVIEIRKKFKKRIYTHKMLAKEYKVSQANIAAITSLKTWNTPEMIKACRSERSENLSHRSPP
jgi:hypothetical protein